MNGPPGKLAVADFASTRRADAAGFADGERGEVVMQEECLFIRSLQRVDILLVFASAECRDHERLRFAAGEHG